MLAWTALEDENYGVESFAITAYVMIMEYASKSTQGSNILADCYIKYQARALFMWENTLSEGTRLQSRTTKCNSRSLCL